MYPIQLRGTRPWYLVRTGTGTCVTREMSRALRYCVGIAVFLLQSTAVHSGSSYQPSGPLQGIDFWTNADAEWFEYPEASKYSNYYLPVANERPDFGIAVSGGDHSAAGAAALPHLAELAVADVCTGIACF